MFEGRRVVAVVPAYNEEKLIGRVLETMPACVDRILIVHRGRLLADALIDEFSDLEATYLKLTAEVTS